MKQVVDAIKTYPWLVPLLLGVLLVGVVLAAVVVLILKKQEEKNVPKFVVLDEKSEEENGNRSQVPVRPFRPPSSDTNMTEGFFEFSDTGLKSYQLKLYDLNMPGVVYQTNLSERVVIGRKASNDICIPNKTLSGEHCEILLKNGKMYLHDLNSKNGTFLNGNKNRVIEEEMRSGSVIEMGAVRMKAELVVFQI